MLSNYPPDYIEPINRETKIIYFKDEPPFVSDEDKERFISGIEASDNMVALYDKDGETCIGYEILWKEPLEE